MDDRELRALEILEALGVRPAEPFVEGGPALYIKGLPEGLCVASSPFDRSSTSMSASTSSLGHSVSCSTRRAISLRLVMPSHLGNSDCRTSLAPLIVTCLPGTRNTVSCSRNDA